MSNVLAQGHMKVRATIWWPSSIPRQPFRFAEFPSTFLRSTPNDEFFSIPIVQQPIPNAQQHLSSCTDDRQAARNDSCCRVALLYIFARLQIHLQWHV